MTSLRSGVKLGLMKKKTTLNGQETHTGSEFIRYVVGFFILIIVVGGFQYFQLRTSVKETVQEILTENTNVKYTIDGINLPITLIFANKVTADVFLKKTQDDITRIEVLVIPKDATPILSMLTGMGFMVEIAGTEILKLQNY